MNQKTSILALTIATATATLRAAELTAPAPATDDAAELAKKLSNPVAALISVPFQNNFDFGGGLSDDGFRYTLNVEPVVPFNLTENWNLISRTIVPFVARRKKKGPFLHCR